MPAVFTKLDAVNEILTGSGFAPVSTLSASGPQSARVAEQFLDRAYRELLAEGWWFNQHCSVTLPINAAGEAVIPANVLGIDGVGDDYIAIQGKVYSKTGKTFIFTAAPEVDVTYFYEFDEVPYEAQSYATKVALRKYQHTRVGGRDALGQHRVDERDARAALMQKEGENGDANLLLNSNLRMHLRAQRIGLDPGY